MNDLIIPFWIFWNLACEGVDLFAGILHPFFNCGL